MSTEIETLPLLPAFARPTSLYLPDVPRTTSLLDTTSYSPFPTFPGSDKTRDPYGLNAYLLHPNDSLWSYVDPIPLPTAPRETPRSASLDGQEKNNSTPPKHVRKQRSLSLLKRPSPLGAQPPVSAEASENEDEAPEFLVRRRSSSIGSSPKLSVEEAAAIVATFRDEAAEPKTPKPKKSIRKAFGKARKSVFGMTSSNNTSPPVPSLPGASALIPPSLSVTLSEDLSPSTPMSSRSNSNYSTASSASSTSSSEGIKTPGEGVPIEIAITGTKLANALQEAGGSKKGKNWSRWLGGKKGKLSAKEMDGSGSLTPGSDSSTSSTPNSSSSDLLAGIAAKSTLTPSPAIITPPSKTTPLIPSSEQLGRQHTWATEQLRRVSMRKITQLKAQSPHPLAVTLRRQHSRLPEEVAFHITAGQRVFPMSVNSYQGADGDLGPAQGGLWLNLAVGGVMIKLNRGEQPEGLLKTRKSSKRSVVPRPRGVHDFITRPPFEERNIVFYPDNVLSPISMARPGYGVWDLDFSPYILALSEVDEPPPSWPLFPRASIAVSDELAEIIKATTETIEEEVIELLDSPTFKTFAQASEEPLTALYGTTPADEKKSPTPSITSLPDASPSASPKPDQRLLPESSFRHLSSRSKGSMSTSSSSEEECAEESDNDDDEPLAQLAKRRSLNFQPRPQSQSSPDLLARPEQHVRSHSQPRTRPSEETKLVKRQISQRTAMEQVTRARERRVENLSGAAERRAEAEQIGRRSSLVDLKVPSSASVTAAATESKHHRRASSGGNLFPSTHSYRIQQEEISRRRISSGLPLPLPQQPGLATSTHLSVHRPETTRRGRSNPELMQMPNGSTSSHLPTRRYHSFYEKSSSSSSGQRLPLPQQQAFIHPHHHHHHQQQQQQRMSMIFPHAQQYHQMMMIPPPQYHHQRNTTPMYQSPGINDNNGRSNRPPSSSKMT